jgi:hypothetical protein
LCTVVYLVVAGIFSAGARLLGSAGRFTPPRFGSLFWFYRCTRGMNTMKKFLFKKVSDVLP